MAMGRNGAVVRQMQRLFDQGTVSGLSERQLLNRFLVQNDDAAFEALVSRHGPMVLGVCRRLLSDPNDVDDAFQATFLVLVKKAKGIQRADLLGNWLYGVAYRVANRVRTNAARRRLREGPEAEGIALNPPYGDGEHAELRAVLDDELDRLPERFRAPLVLCYLQGQTHEEAARRLNCPVGTVRSRMARGRERLRVRLVHRGLAPSIALLAMNLKAEAAPALVSQGLLNHTVKAAIGFAAGRATAAGAVSAAVVTLTRGVSNAMMLHQLKGIAVVVLILGVSAGGAGVVARQIDEGPPTGEKTQTEEDRLRAELAKAKKRIKALESEKAGYAERVRSLTQQLKTSNKDQAAKGPGMMGMMPGAGGMFPGIKGMAGKAGPGGMMPGAGGMPGMMPGMMGAMPGGAASLPGGSAPAMMGAMPGMMGGKPGMMPGMPPGPGGTGMPFSPPGSGVDSLASDSVIVTTSPEKDRISVLNLDSDEGPASYQAENGTKISTVGTGKLLAVWVEGPKISRLAVFEPQTWKWYPLDLPEPISDQATPIVSSNMAVYSFGRHVYAFSAPARRWGVLELEQDAKLAPVVGNQTTTVDHVGHRYYFRAKTGTWVNVDSRTGRVVPINDPTAAQDDPSNDDTP